LLKEIVPEGAGADALEVHVLLLHHAYQFWAAEQPVYQISDEALRRAALEKRITTELPRPAQYLQLPELRVWGAPDEASPPEPLDGMFVSEAGVGGGAIDVLAIFGMRPDRPGFSAVGLEGRADPDDPGAVKSKSRQHATMAAHHSLRSWRAARRPDCTPWPTPASCCCSPAGSWRC
jgi:hypothetical protein